MAQRYQRGRRYQAPAPNPEAQAQGRLVASALRARRRKSILALDLGTVTGWATFDPNTIMPHDRKIDVVTSGFIDMRPKRGESSGIRFQTFDRHLDSLLLGVGMVVYEIVARHLGTHAAQIYGGFLGILEARCLSAGIEYAGVPVGTIKKAATGKGNAKKPDMIIAANRIIERRHSNLNLADDTGLEFQIADDNEADAICLLDHWIRENPPR